jgi:hypothetical protein
MSRLGRNPFEKKVRPSAEAPKPLRAVDIVRQMNDEAIAAAPTPEAAGTVYGTLAKFVLVDLRAESYVFGLKAYLLSLSLFE